MKSFKVLLTTDLGWPRELSSYTPEVWYIDIPNRILIRKTEKKVYTYEPDGYRTELWHSSTTDEVISLYEKTSDSKSFWDCTSILGSISEEDDTDLYVKADFLGWDEFENITDIPEGFIKLYK